MLPLKTIKSLLMDSTRDAQSRDASRDAQSRDLSRTLSTDSSVTGSLSSFELLHAGLIETLLKFLTPQPSDRLDECLYVCHVFLSVFPVCLSLCVGLYVCLSDY